MDILATRGTAQATDFPNWRSISSPHGGQLGGQFRPPTRPYLEQKKSSMDRCSRSGFQSVHVYSQKKPEKQAWTDAAEVGSSPYVLVAIPKSKRSQAWTDAAEVGSSPYLFLYFLRKSSARVSESVLPLCASCPKNKKKTLRLVQPQWVPVCVDKQG